MGSLQPNKNIFCRTKVHSSGYMRGYLQLITILVSAGDVTSGGITIATILLLKSERLSFCHNGRHFVIRWACFRILIILFAVVTNVNLIKVEFEVKSSQVSDSNDIDTLIIACIIAFPVDHK